MAGIFYFISFLVTASAIATFSKPAPKVTYNCQVECLNNGDAVGYPSNCTAYFYCSPSGPFYQSCPSDNLYFDGTECQTDSTKCCDFCTAYCTSGVLGNDIIDPYDCTAYYSCSVEGEPTVRNVCTAGEIFDPNLHSCVVGSTCEPYCSTETTAATVETTTQDNMATTTVTPPSGSCAVDSLCLNQTDGVKVTDPYNCNQYYVCEAELVLPPAIECSNGTFFDGTNCAEETIPCLPECSRYCPTTCDLGIEYIPDSSNCSIFYHCALELQPDYCTEENPYFNGVQCVQDPEECCDTCTPYCTTDDIGGKVSDPNDCTRYFYCFAEGVPAVNESGVCPAGEIFYDATGKCIPGSCEDYCV